VCVVALLFDVVVFVTMFLMIISTCKCFDQGQGPTWENLIGHDNTALFLIAGRRSLLVVSRRR
jgi:hypothetical protein